MQRAWFWNKMTAHFGGLANVKGKKVAVWGVAFKANTDDVRFAPSLYLMEQLRVAGATVTAFDPVAQETGKAAMGNDASDIFWTGGAYEAVEGADALVICTEWREFRSPDFDRIKKLMRGTAIFDGRNLFEAERMRELGFTYTGVGRP